MTKKRFRKWVIIAVIYGVVVGVVSLFNVHYAIAVAANLIDDQLGGVAWTAIHTPVLTIIRVCLLCSFVRTFGLFFAFHVDEPNGRAAIQVKLQKPRWQWLQRLGEKLPDAGLVLSGILPCPLFVTIFLLNISKSRIPRGYAVFLICCGNTVRILAVGLGLNSLNSFLHR